MANIKSAKKRILVNRTKAARNKSIKSATKTAIKKVYAAIDAKDKEAAKAAHSIKDYNLLSKSYEAASGTMDRLGNGAKAMTLLSKALLYRQKSELQED